MSPFEWLYDGHPEDGINEHCSLRGDLAKDGAEAAAVMLKLFERDDRALSVYGQGAHFATGYLRPLRANTVVYVNDEEDEDDGGETIYGTAAEKYAVANDRLDELFYAPCEPEDEGAADWWHLDLVIPAVSPANEEGER